MEKIIKTYEKSSLEYIGNSNSLHKLGYNSKKLENYSTEEILKTLGFSNKEVIYTSGNSESYTFILSNIKDDKRIITDNKSFYEIGKAMNKNIIFSEDLTLDEDTYLVSTQNDIDINTTCLKHIAIKENFKNYHNYDFITLEEIPSFGCLIKDKNKTLEPLIHGGKSTTNYRSGTAATPLIVTLAKIIKTKYKK